MKRAVLCVPDPENYIDQLDDYSIMIVNPKNTPARLGYLLDRADWSLLITNLDYNVGGIFIIINYDVVDGHCTYLNNVIED